MENKSLSVGDRIDARCTKCRKIMNHTLVALVEELPARVKCNTCGGEHNYKNPEVTRQSKAKTAAPKKVRATKAKADPRVAEQQEWETLRPDMNTAKAMDYSMEREFKLDALINHPVFGLGLVQEMGGPRKIIVLFQDGKKLMRCA